MLGGAASGVCCLALLVAIATSAHNEFDHLNLKHTVFKRSSNDSDTLDGVTISDDNKQVPATEVSSLVHEVEKIEDEVKRVDRSGEYANAYRNLDSALRVAQAQPVAEVRTSSALTEAETEAETEIVTEPIKADSNSYALQNLSLENDFVKSEAPSAVVSTSLSQQDKENKQLRRGSGLYQPGYSRIVVPRSEMIYLENVNGAENLVSCTTEGELYKLQTPWNECMVCACVRERGRMQPVCVSCANCAAGAASFVPLDPPTLQSITPILTPNFELQIPIQEFPIQHIPIQEIPMQPGPNIEIPGFPKTCAPFPYGVPFEHPLNPCQLCVCQRDYLKANELIVSCKENSQCAKPPEIPMLPPTPSPASPIATPLCDKFPKDVVFPHPTDPCKLCKCLEYTTLIGTTEQQILCNPDPICGEVPKPYLPVPGPPMLVGPYPNQAKPELFTYGPAGPKQVYPPSPGWVDGSETFVVPADNALYPKLTFNTPFPPQQIPPIIPAPEKYPAPSLTGILFPQEQIFTPEQNEPVLIAEAVSYEVNETPIPSPSILHPDEYTTRPDLKITKLTELPAKPASPQDLIPWPPLTLPAYAKQERGPSSGPLLGPPPHQSCQPYPANTPFQHPWDECQLCVCAEFPTPGHVSIEVNCYTKSICCRNSDTSPPILGLEQLDVQSQNIRNSSPKIQLLDPMCELKSFGVEFPSPREPCKVCSCHQVGSLIVPSCRNAESPFCKTKIAPVLTRPITFIEPRCRNRMPERPFVVECNVCVCHTVFTYVISKCTPQPKCLNKLDIGNEVIEAQATALANTQSGGSYSQSFVNNAPIYQNRNLLLPRSDALYNDNTNILSQLQGNNYYQFGQFPHNQMYGLKPQSNISPAQEAANLLATFSQNSPINVIKASASGQLGFSPDIVQTNAQQYQSHWTLPQTTNSAPVSSQSFSSAQAFIDAINGRQNLQNPYYGYPDNLQSQSGPEIIHEATSIVSPTHNTGYDTLQQTYPYQNFLRSYPDTTQANILSTTPVNIYSNPKSYPLYLPSQNFKQLDPATLAPTEVSSPNYLSSSNAYAYSESSMTPFAQKTATPSSWDSTTLAYHQGDANARTQLQAAANSGSIRGGRGQCQYAGDMYHRNCQACTCFADEKSSELYSMCSGKPCH